MIVSIKSYFLSHKGRRPNVRRPNGRAPKRRRPNACAQTAAPKRPAPISSPLPTYNMRNHHVNTAVMSTLQAPLLPTVCLRYTSSNSNSGTTFFSTISCLFILIHLISLPHQRARNPIKHSICSPIRTYNISNRHVRTLHVFFFSMTLSFPQLLSIIRPIHLQILTQAPLFSHFPSKNLNKYTSSPKIPSKCLHDLAKIIPLHHHAPPFIQHFLLIMCEIVM